MPVCHVVLFKTREGLDPAETESIVPAWRQSILKVPGVISAHLGPITSADGQGFSHMAHVQLVDAEALAAYGPHPDHLAVIPLTQGKVVSYLIADLHEPD